MNTKDDIEIKKREREPYTRNLSTRLGNSEYEELMYFSQEKKFDIQSPMRKFISQYLLPRLRKKDLEESAVAVIKTFYNKKVVKIGKPFAIFLLQRVLNDFYFLNENYLFFRF
mgnify:CR=1 FL=1